MSEEIENAPRTYSGALLAAIAVALLAAVGSLIWCFTLTGKLTTAQDRTRRRQAAGHATCRRFARDQRPIESRHG
ncbi:MAG: hypothetical protein WDM87_09440 [Terracidiphilus sp.]